MTVAVHTDRGVHEFSKQKRPNLSHTAEEHIEALLSPRARGSSFAPDEFAFLPS